MANSRANSSGLLFNPNTYDPPQFDPETRRQLRALIDWFESRGKARLLQDDLDAEWVSDFLDFIGKERIFATFLTLVVVPVMFWLSYRMRQGILKLFRTSAE